MRRHGLICLVTVLTLSSLSCGHKSRMQAAAPHTTFTVTIENISQETSLSSPLAPGLWAISTKAPLLYKAGHKEMGKGLEPLAEDGMPGPLLTSLLRMDQVAAAGIFDTPTGMDKPGPLMPGASYSFSFRAMPGDHLFLATMLVQSNDLFFGTMPMGIPLFNEGVPFSGELTSRVALWDCGTEINEALGTGMFQAPRQRAPNMGTPEFGTVHKAMGSLPAVSTMIRVTIRAIVMHPPPKRLAPIGGHSDDH